PPCPSNRRKAPRGNSDSNPGQGVSRLSGGARRSHFLQRGSTGGPRLRPRKYYALQSEKLQHLCAWIPAPQACSLCRSAPALSQTTPLVPVLPTQHPPAVETPSPVRRPRLD